MNDKQAITNILHSTIVSRKALMPAVDPLKALTERSHAILIISYLMIRGRFFVQTERTIFQCAAQYGACLASRR